MRHRRKTIAPPPSFCTLPQRERDREKGSARDREGNIRRICKKGAKLREQRRTEGSSAVRVEILPSSLRQRTGRQREKETQYIYLLNYSQAVTSSSAGTALGGLFARPAAVREGESELVYTRVARQPGLRIYTPYSPRESVTKASCRRAFLPYHEVRHRMPPPSPSYRPYTARATLLFLSPFTGFFFIFNGLASREQYIQV